MKNILYGMTGHDGHNGHIFKDTSIVDCGYGPLRMSFLCRETLSHLLGRGYLVDVQFKDLEPWFLWIPSIWIENFKAGDITDWPVWLMLTCEKIVRNKNRNALEASHWPAVFWNVFRSVVLEETGEDFKAC